MKKRAVNSPDNTVGKQRQELYIHAVVQIKQALENGFFLEAIAIEESLIADRLESRLSQLLGWDFSHKTLNKLISTTRNKETDQALRDIVLNDLDEWRKARNSAIHEMVKLDDGDTRTWQDRMEALGPIAKSGFKLFRVVDRNISRLRKSKKK